MVRTSWLCGLTLCQATCKHRSAAVVLRCVPARDFQAHTFSSLACWACTSEDACTPCPSNP